MAADTDNDFVIVNPENKEDEAEAPKINISNLVKHEMHPFSNKIMNGQDNTVLCMIRRDKAVNPVVYRAKYKDDNKNNGFDTTKPIEIFWLKIAQGSIKNNRKAGKMDDRVEVSYMESKLAYGIQCDQIGNKQEFKVKFNALPKMECILKQCHKHSKPKLFGSVDGKQCYLKDIHVTMKKNW